MPFGDQVENFVSNTETLLVDLDKFIKQTEDFRNEWILEDTDSLNKLYDDAKYEIDINNKKILRKPMQCAVFGRISAGKSTIINALLTKDILPNDNGFITNSFVEIKKSGDGTDYVIFDDKPERENLDTIRRVNSQSNDQVKHGSYVRVFYSAPNTDILDNNVIIIDTPGIDNKLDMDKSTHDICKESDVLVLVVSATTAFGETEKNFLLKHHTLFSKLKLIIVFNYWEKMQENNKDNYIKAANDYLCDTLHVKNNRDSDGIFLISAKERLKIKTNKDVTRRGWEERDKSFDAFCKCLKEYLAENCENRLLSIKSDNIRIITTTFDKIRYYYKEQHPRLVEKVNDTLVIIEDLNEIINKEVKLIFERNYEPFFDKGLEMRRMNANQKTDKILMQNFDIFLSEQMIVIIESLKLIINDILNAHSCANKQYERKVLEELYFNKYLKLEKKTVDKTLQAVFKEIEQTIALCRGITTAVIAVPATGLAIVGGINAGIAVEMATEIAAPLFAATGGLSVGGGVGLASYFLTQIKKLQRYAYSFTYIKNEDIIKKWYKSMEIALQDSYQRFLKNIPGDVMEVTSKLGINFKHLETKLEKFNEEWNPTQIHEYIITLY